MRNELEKIIREAGVYLAYCFLNPGYDVKIKEDGSEVTEVDIFAQDIIMKRLKEAFPSVSVVSEELSSVHNIDSINNNCFVVDPLDSTKNFISGIPYFDISIAYLERGVPIFGMVFLPMLNELFWAGKGMGAYLNNKPIHVSKCKELLGADINVNTHKLTIDKSEKVIGGLYGKVKAVRHFGCAVAEVCYVAKGAIDALVNQKLSLWDFAACTLILNEAGGVVSDLSGKELNYKSFEQQTLLAASTRELHRNLLRLTN